MTTISLTPLQVQSLRTVFIQFSALAEKSPNIAALLDISPRDLERVQSLLDSLPKPLTDGGNPNPLPSILRPAHAQYGTEHPHPTVATASAAHGDQ